MTGLEDEYACTGNNMGATREIEHEPLHSSTLGAHHSLKARQNSRKGCMQDMTSTHGNLRFILALVTLSSALKLSLGTENLTNFKNIVIGFDGSVTLSFVDERDVQRRTVVVSLDTIGSRSTFTTAVHFGVPVTVNLTLSRALVWRKTPRNPTDEFVWIVEQTGTQKSLKWTKSEDQYKWINDSSINCTYLSTKLGHEEKTLEVNETVTLNTEKIVFYLRNNPSDKWCDIHIELIATPLVANYCQVNGHRYCYKSRRCLNISAWCDGHSDCDQEEDEVNCVKSTPLLFLVVFGITLAIIFVTAFLVIYVYFKRCRNALSRFRSTKMDKHLYDYPKFSEAFNLHTDCSPVSDSISEQKLHMPQAFSELYDSSGIYSRVITVSNAM